MPLLSDPYTQDARTPLPAFRDVIESRFQYVREVGAYGTDAFSIARLLQRFPDRVRLEASRDHTVNVSVGGSFEVERYDGDKLVHRIGRPDSVTVIPAGLESTWRASGLVDVLQIYLDDGGVRTFAEEQLGFPSERLEVYDLIEQDDPFLRSLAPTLLLEISGDAGGDPLLLDSFRLVLTRHFLRRYTNAGSQRPVVAHTSDSQVVARATDYIRQNLDRALRLDDIAASVGVPELRLRACFKARTGMTPYQFVLQARMSRAQELLASDELPISEVAYTCGFSSQSHLTATFSGRLGVTPGEYRRSLMR